MQKLPCHTCLPSNDNLYVLHKHMYTIPVLGWKLYPMENTSHTLPEHVSCNVFSYWLRPCSAIVTFIFAAIQRHAWKLHSNFEKKTIYPMATKLLNETALSIFSLVQVAVVIPKSEHKKQGLKYLVISVGTISIHSTMVGLRLMSVRRGLALIQQRFWRHA